jgi:hypothetical protein
MSLISPDCLLQVSHPPKPRTRSPSPLLVPDLLKALTELAAAEDLPVTTLIAVLINEALAIRLRR